MTSAPQRRAVGSAFIVPTDISPAQMSSWKERLYNLALSRPHPALSRRERGIRWRMSRPSSDWPPGPRNWASVR